MDPVSYFYSMLGFEQYYIGERPSEIETISKATIVDDLGEKYIFRPIKPPAHQHDVDALSHKLLEIYIDGFMHRGESLTPEREVAFLDDLRSHISGAERLALIEKDGATVGFVLSEVLIRDSERIYYLGGIILSPKVQGRELATAILANELRESNADVLAFHTQSAKMFRVGCKLAEYSEALADKIALEIHSQHAQGSVDRERYRTGSLYGDIEQFRQQAVSGINFEKGDAKIFAGRVTVSRTPIPTVH